MDVVELGVRVTMENGQAVAQQLDQIAASGAKAEAATQRYIGSNDGLTISQRSLIDQGVSLERVLAALGGTSQAYAGQTGAVTEAVEAEAVAHQEAATAAGAHGLQLGRLNMELGTLDGRLLGVNTALTRFTAMLGGSVVGYQEMITALVAIGGVMWVWDKMTEGATKAREAQDKLTESLHKWHEEQGAGNARSSQTSAAEADLAQQEARLASLQAPRTFSFSDTEEQRIGEQIAQVKANILKDKADIAAGLADVDKSRSAAFDQEQQAHSQSLAELVKYHATDTTVREQALQQLKVDQTLETQYLKAGMDDRAALYAKAADTLSKALFPKDASTSTTSADDNRLQAFTDELERLQAEVGQFGKDASIENRIRGIDDQLDQYMQRVQQQVATGKVSQEQFDAIGASVETLRQGFYETGDAMRAAFDQKTMDQIAAEHDQALRLNDAINQGTDAYNAAKDAIAVENELKQKGITIDDTRYEQAKAELEQTRALNDATKERAELLKGIQSDVTAQARSVTPQSLQAALDAMKNEQQQYSDEIQKIWVDGLEKIITNGTKSFHNFFDDVLSMFSQLMEAMKKKGDTGFDFKALGYASSAISGGLEGYQMGESTGSTALGTLGGAAAGAATGAEIAGPWGAVIGGLTGAVGGLFGASDAQKKAAEELQKAADAAALSLAQYNLKAGLGGTTSLDVSERQNQSTADQLYDQINAALPGLKNQTEREKELAQVREDEVAITQQLIAADKLARQQFDDSAQARILAAEGDVAGAAAIRQRLADQKELDDATKQFGADSSQVTELLAAQSAEAVQRAQQAAEASRTIDENLSIREAEAKGLTDEADALKRQQQEEQELQQAEQAGWTAAQIARLQEIQALEDEAAAAKKAADAAERYAESMASLNEQFLSLTGQTDAAAMATLLEQQRQDTLKLQQTDGVTPGELQLQQVVQLLQRGQLEAQQQIKAQTDALNAQLKTQQDALSVAQQQLSTLKQAADSLAQYRDSLVTGSLSPLSPIQQLNAAEAQMAQLFAAAQGGDPTAAGQFSGAANTYLQQAKSYYGSSSGYSDAFGAVQQMTGTLADQYGHQASLAQQTVDALNAQIKLLQDQLTKLQDQNTLTEMTKEAVVAELESTRDATLAPNGALIDQLNALKDTLTGVGQQIVLGERDILVGDQNNLTSATQAEIGAINAGASAQQIAQLDAVRQLELQKTAQDDYYAQQLQETAKIYGWDSPQVQSIIDLQTKYDAGVEQQINAINGIAPALAALIRQAPTTAPPDTGGYGQGQGPQLGGGTGTNYTSDTTGKLFDPFMNLTYYVPLSTTSYTDPGQNTWGNGLWTSADGNTTFPGDIVRFASGGDFGGGLRLVGEMGPELETTGPSRITSSNDLSTMFAKALSGNADLVEAQKAQLRESQAQVRLLQTIGQQHGEKLDRLSAAVDALAKHTQLNGMTAGVRVSA